MIQMPDIQAIKVMIKAVLTANLAIIMGNPLPVASKMGENLLCYKLHLNSQQTSPIVSNHFAL